MQMKNKKQQNLNEKRIGLIVFRGNLPLEVANQAKKNGISIHAINIIGYADPQSSLATSDWHFIGAIGEIINTLKRENCDSVCFAGQVNRPDFSSLKLDRKAILELPRVLLAAGKGDDELLRAIVSIFEREGFGVVSPQEIANSLLAPLGRVGQLTPSKQDFADMQKAGQIVAAIGKLDVGQGAVVCNGLVLAVEAQEGTNEMLKRCAALPKEIRGSTAKRSGVLLKLPKPGQDRRVDLPTLGAKTVQLASLAGLSGIAFASGASFLIDQKEMCRLANKEKMFLWGMEPLS